MFIRAIAGISSQETFRANELPAEMLAYEGKRLKAVEPDYKEWVDPKMIRRMSRVIKMGVASASLCLKNAGIGAPDAIVTGTAYGCLDDTGIFINRMLEFNEEMLNPTAFIQSTHNTVGAQIALSVKCHGYNNTFVHRGVSFESAVLDSILLLKDRHAKNVLVGAADELTDLSFSILDRFGIYREDASSTASLVATPSKGTVAGEGAAFFLLTAEADPDNVAALDAIHTFYKPADIAEVKQEIITMLAVQSLTIDDIDLIIDGRNGDANNDAGYAALAGSFFTGSQVVSYKHLCGEYPTSTSFALWYASMILKAGSVKGFGIDDVAGKQPGKILIYNHYKNIHHSLFLVSAC
ncbi:MAG: beta-ketoacyl synthase N-terminal-like domain-containing protein [Flavitalea sp.]